MTLIAAKAKLLDYIEHADEEKIMAVLSLFESDNDQKHVYDEDTLNRLRKRSAQYLAGNLKTYSIEESMDRIKQYRLANGL